MLKDETGTEPSITREQMIYLLANLRRMPARSSRTPSRSQSRSITWAACQVWCQSRSRRLMTRWRCCERT